MTAQVFAHNKSTKVEIAMAVSMFMGLNQRGHECSESSPRRQEAFLAATNTACDAMAKFGWEAWGEAVLKMEAQFPDHDWLRGHSQQVVWFAQH